MCPTYYTQKFLMIDLYNNILEVEGLSKFCGHMCWATRAILARFESQQTTPTCKSPICLFLFNTANLWTMDHYFYMIYELKAIFWTWLYGPIAEGACLVLTMVLHRELDIVGGTISILSFVLAGFSNYQSAVVVMLVGRRKFPKTLWS